MSIRESIRKIIAADRPDRSWTAHQMLAALINDGWTTTTRKPLGVVHGALALLYDSAELDRIERGTYVASPEHLRRPSAAVTTPGRPVQGLSVALRRPYEPVQIYAPIPEELIPLPKPKTVCSPWGGRKDWYQHEARQTNSINKRYLWIVPTCATRMCLIHIKALRPLQIDYLPDVCIYCGFWGESRDHLIPRGWSGDVDRSWVLTVPACRECNSGIGAQWAPTITERRALAHKFIKRKYKRYLVGSIFTQEDLEEMGRNLRSMIEGGIQVGELTRNRLAWPPFGDYDLQAAQRSGIDDPYVIGLIK